MTSSTILLYAIASFAATITPGPTMLLALSNGASRDKRVAAMGILGAALSDLVLIGAVSLGLGAVLAASEALFSVVQWVGVGYLVWLSVRLWRSSPASLSPATMTSGTAPPSPARAFARSFLVAVSNPKGLLFFSAFLPQFITTTAPQAPQYLVLALVTTLLDMLVMACYAAGGGQAARLLSAKGLQRLNRACAAILLSMAGILAGYRRSNA